MPGVDLNVSADRGLVELGSDHMLALDVVGAIEDGDSIRSRWCRRAASGAPVTHVSRGDGVRERRPIIAASTARYRRPIGPSAVRCERRGACSCQRVMRRPMPTPGRRLRAPNVAPERRRSARRRRARTAWWCEELQTSRVAQRSMAGTASATPMVACSRQGLPVSRGWAALIRSAPGLASFDAQTGAAVGTCQWTWRGRSPQ